MGTWMEFGIPEKDSLLGCANRCIICMAGINLITMTTIKAQLLVYLTNFGKGISKSPQDLNAVLIIKVMGLSGDFKCTCLSWVDVKNTHAQTSYSFLLHEH